MSCCKFDGCERSVEKKGLCNGHYQQRRKGQDLKPLRVKRSPICSFGDCDKPHYAKGLCSGHYTQQIKNKELIPLYTPKIHCDYPGCTSPHYGHGLCNAHWQQVYRGNGLSDVTPHSAGWLQDGYRVFRVDGRPVKEHRFIYEQYYKVELLPTQEIHHRNGVRDDNRIENLQLWDTSQPSGQLPEDKVVHAIEILKLYRPEALAEEYKDDPGNK